MASSEPSLWTWLCQAWWRRLWPIRSLGYVRLTWCFELRRALIGCILDLLARWYLGTEYRFARGSAQIQPRWSQGYVTARAKVLSLAQKYNFVRRAESHHRRAQLYLLYEFWYSSWLCFCFHNQKGHENHESRSRNACRPQNWLALELFVEHLGSWPGLEFIDAATSEAILILERFVISRFGRSLFGVESGWSMEFT